MKRVGFNNSAESDSTALAATNGPKLCAANGCMFPGSVAENSHATSWWCSYHFNCPVHELPRITSVLNQHHVLRDAILSGRSALVHGDVNLLPVTWQRLRDEVAAAGYTVPAKRGSETFNGWLWEVEMLLGRYVRGMRSPPPPAPPPASTYTPPATHNIGDLLDGLPKPPEEPAP